MVESEFETKRDRNQLERTQGQVRMITFDQNIDAI